MRDERLLRELTQFWGVAGFEKEVRKFIEKEAAPYGDEMYTDAMGNLIVCKKGTGGDREDAMKAVNLGDACGYMGEYLELMNDRICTKSLDDRIGCYQLLEALKENDGCFNDIYYVFCVQEELGCRGSKPAAERIRPDIGIAVDVTPAHDYPCDLEGSNKVDGGIGIRICDPSVVIRLWLQE